MCVAPKGSRHPGVLLVLGLLEAAGTLQNPLGQGQHQRGSVSREKGWCVAEVMAQQGSPGAAGSARCQWGQGTGRVCPIKKGLQEPRPIHAWVPELGQASLQGPGLLEGKSGLEE